MNTIKNGLYLEEFPHNKPSEKRISSAGDISALSSTANRQKSSSNFGLSQKTMNNESQKLTTIANRNRQQQMQNLPRSGAQSGIEVRRKSNENVSRKSFTKKMATGGSGGADDARAYQETASEWNNAQGDGVPLHKPPSSLKSGQALDSFDIQESRAVRQEQRMTMHIKKQVELPGGAMHHKNVADSNNAATSQNNNYNNSSGPNNETAKMFSRVNSKTQQSPIYSNNQRKQSFTKMSQQCHEKTTNSNKMDQDFNSNDERTRSKHNPNVTDDGFSSVSPSQNMHFDEHSTSNHDRKKNKTEAAIESFNKLSSQHDAAIPFKITRDSIKSNKPQREENASVNQYNAAVMMTNNTAAQRNEKGRVNSLANGRIQKNSAGSNIYVDIAQFKESQNVHVTPKNAQIILPLQGPNGSIPRNSIKNGQTQVPVFMDFQDKRLGYHKSSSNPYKQQINHIIQARDNYFQSKVKQFQQSDYKSDATGSNPREHPADPQLNTTPLLQAAAQKQDSIRKKNQKNIANDKAALPFFSKVIQGISPVLESTQRKNFKHHQVVDQPQNLLSSAGAKKNSAMLPPSNSGQLLSGFPIALQHEVRAYQQHHSNFSYMLKQTINDKNDRNQNYASPDDTETENRKIKEPIQKVRDPVQEVKNRHALHNYDQQDMLLQSLHDQFGRQQLHIENLQKQQAGHSTSGTNKRHQSRQKREQSSNALPMEGCIMFDDVAELEQEMVRQLTDDKQKTMKVGIMPNPIDQLNPANFDKQKYDPVRILPPQAKYPQFSQFMPISKRMGQTKKQREGNKSLNKNVLPLQSLQGLSKMSNQVSQRSLRALHIEQSRIQKNSENQKLCNELKIEQQFKYI